MVTLHFHPWQYLVRGWLYCDTIFLTPDNIWWGGDYIVTSYFHSWQYLVRGCLYRDMIFSPLTIFGQGVIISWYHIFTPDNIWGGGDYIVTWYFHSWQYLVWGWLYRDIIFSLLIILVRGVILSRHYIFTLGNIWWGGDYIVTLYFHSWQYLGWGWLYRDMILSLLTIFGVGVIISWHHIFTPDNIGERGDFIATLHFHSWQYLVRGWLYRDIIFSLMTIFGEGVIISWHNFFTPDDIWWGVILSWHYIFTLGNIWWGGDYIVTLYFHSWQYLVRGWLYRDTIFSLLAIFGVGVIILWHYIIIPDTTLASATGGDYIWIFSLSKFDCSDTRVLLFISIYSPHEVIIFKHDTLFAVET